jgi:hypothetical protein
MTVELPIGHAHVWFINATNESVDVYVNYADKPLITDLKGLEIGPEFQVKGKDDTPFGAYTFSARPKADPNGAVLASASAFFEEGKSFSAVLQETSAGGHQWSIYENDFSPTGRARMTVRHTARPLQIAWRIAPKDAKPEIPVDKREGALQSSQWQVATNVVQNDYRLEVLVGGEVVAAHPDLELEHEKDRTVYVVGDPKPTTDPLTLRKHVLQQEFQLPQGPVGPAEVTTPQEPVSTTDQNGLIDFTTFPVELWQTNATTTQISAIDPDGVVTNLSIDSVDPAVGGILITGNSVTPAAAIGGTARATVEILQNVTAGEYEVTIVANRGSLGHQATAIVPVSVRAITIARLRGLVSEYELSGDIQGRFASILCGLLDEAEQHLNAGAAGEACEILKRLLAEVGSEKGKAIAEPAADQLDREAKALRSDLGCG